MKRYNLTALLFALALMVLPVHAQRTRVSMDKDWKFSFGNAADPAKDFGHGTEYFNYLTKANSIHNTGPYSSKFDASSWTPVSLPHDFVVDLPFKPEASASHGYKTVGYKYPETSVGWYRKTFNIPESDRGKHIELLFEGIFRDSKVWVNGFYCGGEPSGYLSKHYDITDYVNYGGENLVCVRCDATFEEGWFYEGGGIYRHVWMTKTEPLHVAQDGLCITTSFPNSKQKDYTKAEVMVTADLFNASHESVNCQVKYYIKDREGKIVSQGDAKTSASLRAMEKVERTSGATLLLDHPNLWSTDSPYLYTLVAQVVKNGKVTDEKTEYFGVREIVFDKDNGLLVNGKNVKIKGFNLHQDHAGVGAAIPDAVQAYRIRQMKSIGFNAYRSSHNPMSPAMLDVCDSLGVLVIDENRLSGINHNEIDAMRRMIMRDRNHPSVIMWSAGNEEWGIEWDKKGELIAATMLDYCHQFDPSRPMTFATSSGPTVVVPVDVAGYNYIMQNPVDEHRKNYPERKCFGSEETTGCGTRGVYFPDSQNRWIPSLNRGQDRHDSTYNAIERGWRFYAERPWAAGCFYWTGFDYRGEPAPLGFPATGSQFGVFDYCGFPKDEAHYLRAWWTDETVLHILPHWNLSGHEGENIKVWAYSNCDEIELFVNGRSVGKKTMPKYGHLEWDAVYKPGKLKAVGYRGGKRVKVTTVETTGPATRLSLAADRSVIVADSADVAVVNISMCDSKERFVPDASMPLTLHVDGDATIIGVGNGDPATHDPERPTTGDRRDYTVKSFNGLAQVLIQAGTSPSEVTLTVSGEELKTSTVVINTVESVK